MQDADEDGSENHLSVRSPFEKNSSMSFRSHSRTRPRALRWSKEGGLFLMSEVPLHDARRPTHPPPPFHHRLPRTTGVLQS